jgi:hypothetical protein
MASVLIVAVVAACILYPMLTRPCLSRLHKRRHWRWSGRHTT